jgi:hypothetical protein
MTNDGAQNLIGWRRCCESDYVVRSFTFFVTFTKFVTKSKKRSGHALQLNKGSQSRLSK